MRSFEPNRTQWTHSWSPRSVESRQVYGDLNGIALWCRFESREEFSEPWRSGTFSIESILNCFFFLRISFHVPWHWHCRSWFSCSIAICIHRNCFPLVSIRSRLNRLAKLIVAFPIHAICFPKFTFSNKLIRSVWLLPAANARHMCTFASIALQSQLFSAMINCPIELLLTLPLQTNENQNKNAKNYAAKWRCVGAGSA